MDSSGIAAIIATIISSQVVIRIVDGWVTGRATRQTNDTKRLDRLEAALEAERKETEKFRVKLFDLAVLHEGLKVRFDMLQTELVACRDREQKNGKVSN